MRGCRCATRTTHSYGQGCFCGFGARGTTKSSHLTSCIRNFTQLLALSPTTCVFDSGMRSSKTSCLHLVTSSDEESTTHFPSLFVPVVKTHEEKTPLPTYSGFGCVWLTPNQGHSIPFHHHKVTRTRGHHGTRIALSCPHVGVQLSSNEPWQPYWSAVGEQLKS